MEKTLISTKDNLLNMLNDASGHELFDNMETVMTTIQLTTGLWFECDYAYKAIEILQIILDHCNRMEAYTKLHYRTVCKINDIKNKAYKLQDFMHKNKRDF